MKDILVIAAACRSGGIGYKGNLPWRLKNEMAFFTRQTSTPSIQGRKNAVIMGRKTWESIPPKFRPLSNRVNVVLSSTLNSKPDGADYLFPSLTTAVEKLSSVPDIDKLWIIGGSMVYEEAVSSGYCRHIYLTKIDADYKCDTFFPSNIEEGNFVDVTKQVSSQEGGIPEGVQEENGVKYQFHVFERKK
jgi:dihydrofolate reductase